MSTRQTSLIEFTTRRPSTPLFCHQEFLDELSEHGRNAIARKASFLMQRMATDARRLHYKSTQGENRGWRRSRLGGNFGSHYYAWWAPATAAPFREGEGFGDAPESAIILRAIRHHDDHTPLSPHGFASHYMPLSVPELRNGDYTVEPLTPPQLKFTTARQPVRLLKGYPGSGKTTALWNAADAAGMERVLYVTWSRDLAGLAREHFDRFCSAAKDFQVFPYGVLLRDLTGSTLPLDSELEGRKRFRTDILPLARSLGPWGSSPAALYDEIHAHLVGEAVPTDAGRFTACAQPRLPDKIYRERRSRALGPHTWGSAVDGISRLEKQRDATGSLASRYCPDLELAWQTAEALSQGRIPDRFLGFDCIAVDEVQDLTPVELLVLVELTQANIRESRKPVTLLLAGDEAQTVRPTDFEWGWLSDMMNHRIGKPVEYKLAANLRSPRRIAELVNKVWDLYSYVGKQDRPGGSGYAEIEDDSPDEVVQIAGAPGEDLSQLLIRFAEREGLAIITTLPGIPDYVPAEVRGAVLTIAEAKGLDFHSVCILDGSRLLEQIVTQDARIRAYDDILELEKRLAIDRLRVALSRPTERLYWLDVSPTDSRLRTATSFLRNRPMETETAVPAAVLKSMDEEELDLEERVQRCQTDARQFLQIKPDLALSRARQAVSLTGTQFAAQAGIDEAAADAAFLTLAEVAFSLGFRGTRLAAEYGKLDLFEEARHAAVRARKGGLARILQLIGEVQKATLDSRLNALADMAQGVADHQNELEPWVLVEIAPKLQAWMDQMEAAMFDGNNAGILIRILPPFYEVVNVPDRIARTSRLQQKAISVLMKDKQFSTALVALRALTERQPKLEATCLDALGNFQAAADAWLEAGMKKEALQSYRSIPDFPASLKLVREIGGHPAEESLEWVGELQKLVERRPKEFNKVMLAPEKKLLEALLEQGLGVQRKKAAPKKAAVKKATVKKVAATKKAAAKKPSRRPYF